MKASLVALALLLSASLALGDGNGTDILPFSTPGGQITGTVTIYPDGGAVVVGQLQGVSFTTLGKATRDSDGHFHFDPLLSDADKLIKKKSWVPLIIDFWGTTEDANDGDDGDDSVGSIEVRSQTGTGKGSVQLSG